MGLRLRLSATFTQIVKSNLSSSLTAQIRVIYRSYHNDRTYFQFSATPINALPLLFPIDACLRGSCILDPRLIRVQAFDTKDL